MPSSKGTAFLINPLFVHQKKHSKSKSSTKPLRKIIQSIVTPIPISIFKHVHDSNSNIPNHGELQICIEEYHQNDSALFRRVAVRSYGDITEDGGLLHASFSLPLGPLPAHGKEWISWADFEGKAYLCILAGPETLRIFDVYPSAGKSVIGGGEGHSVSLPFEASGIFSLQGFENGGLLIQRQPNLAGQQGEFIGANVNVETRNDSVEFDAVGGKGGEGKQPLGPPSTLRLGVDPKRFLPRLNSDGPMSTASSCSSDLDIDRMVSAIAASGGMIPSLYSLHHPLDEIRPCLTIPKEKDEKDGSKNIVHFCNVSEEIVFVGRPRSFTRELSDIIVVTFDCIEKCHRVWILKEAPPPPDPVPLWKLTSRNPNVNIATAASFSNLHAKVALSCIHTFDEPGLNKQASRVFLATTEDSTGDFILALLQSAHGDEMQCKLNCVEFDPFGESMEACSSWNVIDKYSLPCNAAVPIEATAIDLRPFSLVEDRQNVSQRNFLRKKYGSKAPKARDILLCRKQGSAALYRGNAHLVDIDIPSPKTTLSLPVIGLENSVNSRVDAVCGTKLATTSIRVSCSLSSALSSVTDTALAALGSAMAVKGKDYIALSFAIRADSLRFAQFRASETSTSSDIEWESFSIIVAIVIAMGTGVHFDNELIRCCDSIQDDDPWSNLLQSSYHMDYIRKNSNKLFLGLDEEKVPEQVESATLSQRERDFLSTCKCVSILRDLDRFENISDLIFNTLHMLYEDCKIKNGANSITVSVQIGELLFRICQMCKVDNRNLMEHYEQHYIQHIPTLRESRYNIVDCLQCNISKRITDISNPPCLYYSLEKIMESKDMALEQLHENFTVNGACASSGSLLQFYLIAFAPSSSSDMVEADRKLAIAIVEEGFHCVSSLVDMFSQVILLPLMDSLFRCRLNPPPIDEEWSAAAYTLIGRNDLARIKNGARAIGVTDCALISTSFVDGDPDNDGLVSVEKRAAMLFPNDKRIHEAARLVRSSRPLFLRVPRAPEVSDHDFERLKQQKLALLCRRSLPLPVGRGMFTIGTLDRLPIEPLPMPKICLAGRIPPQNAILGLEENRCTSKHKMWPDFHNGVAAGLRLPLAKDGGKRLTRTWIVCNRPKPLPPPSVQGSQPAPTPDPDHTYGGFLFALGLRGHLSALDKTDIVDYINKGPVTTAVGMMLGLAANKRGSCDVTIFKTLCVHIPSLLPTSFRSIDLSSSVQTAAVAGVGLLCQGTSHRLLTEFLLNEIGKRPTVDQNTDDRESYHLCCGISLGMVNLCLAESSEQSVNDGLSDLNIEERLHRYIVGGVDNSFDKQRQHNSERTPNSGIVDSEKSSRIYEGPMINTDITAPGATLAVGMIYHRSGSKPAASLVALPQTLFDLDIVRPDFLFLRVVSRSLILWDDIEPTIKWINAQIPDVVKAYYAKFRRKAERSSGIDGLATFAAMRMSNKGNVSAVQMKGSDNSKSVDGDQGKEEAMKDDLEMEVDYNSIRQAHAYITSGICFSLGLRYAGTGNEEACGVIFEKVLELQKLRDGNDSISLALRPDTPTVDMCLGSAAISLAMVMAGTGNLEVFRLFKTLRWKCDMDVKYGNHMAYASAIGLLFLGGGSCTLGNEPSDIAALIISMFPRVPIFTHDNRYHLQALSHLYALAVKERKVEAIDVDSNEKVLLPMKFDFCNNDVQNVMSPTILLNKGTECKVTIDSDRYYPAEIHVKDLSSLDSTLSLFVKKKAGRLSYAQDPNGLRSLFSQIRGAREKPLVFVQSFIDRKVNAFTKYICEGGNYSDSILEHESKPTSLLAEGFESFCENIVYQGLKGEKTESIMIYLYLYGAISMLEKQLWPSKTLCELRILRLYYQTSNSFELVNPHFVATICEKLDRISSKNTSNFDFKNNAITRLE